MKEVDVLCVGHASYDLVFSVAHHPKEDEKTFANEFLGCGGGPAANAAVTIARLGYRAAFAGYLGKDIYGEMHMQELGIDGVDTDLIVRGDMPTAVSMVLVKPDGKRSLVNFKDNIVPLSSEALDFTLVKPKAILFDGHEPYVSMKLLQLARQQNIPTILDAGSVHEGTLMLMGEVDYLVCSEKFAVQIAGDVIAALDLLANESPCVVITLGEHGLIWRRGRESGTLSAISLNAVDTTGAGDAFHGAFAAALVSDMHWSDLLKYASAAGALCCMKNGARKGLPSRKEHDKFIKNNKFAECFQLK